MPALQTTCPPAIPSSLILQLYLSNIIFVFVKKKKTAQAHINNKGTISFLFFFCLPHALQLRILNLYMIIIIFIFNSDSSSIYYAKLCNEFFFFSNTHFYLVVVAFFLVPRLNAMCEE